MMKRRTCAQAIGDFGADDLPPICVEDEADLSGRDGGDQPLNEIGAQNAVAETHRSVEVGP